MKAIVTGATGFVGKALVQELVDNGIDVIAIVRNSKKVPKGWMDYNRVQVVYGDLCKLDELDKSDMMDADIFYHLGWYGTSGMDRADIYGQLNNIKSACDAVELSVACRCKAFVNAGSIMEYEVIKLMNSGAYSPGMANIYSTAKLTANFMARTLANKLKIKYINVIISNIYGVGEKSERFLNTTLRKMLKDEPIPLTSGEQLYDFIYITDAVKIIFVAGMEGKDNESYYVGNIRQKPLKVFLMDMKNILNSQSELQFGAVPLIVPTITYDEFDTSKAEQELQVSPKVDFREGIIRLKEWIMVEEDEQ